MALVILGFAFVLLLFRLTLRLRLGIPLLYSILMLTAFHGWYQAHSALADGILFAMVCLAALSWAVTLGRKLMGVFGELLEDWTAARALADRVRSARLAGSSVVSTEDMF